MPFEKLLLEILFCGKDSQSFLLARARTQEDRLAAADHQMKDPIGKVPNSNGLFLYHLQGPKSCIAALRRRRARNPTWLSSDNRMDMIAQSSSIPPPVRVNETPAGAGGPSLQWRLPGAQQKDLSPWLAYGRMGGLESGPISEPSNQRKCFNDRRRPRKLTSQQVSR